MQVRNLRTGVISDYPEKTARWLISTGSCEAVKRPPAMPPAAPEATAVAAPAKRSYKRKDLKAEG